MSEDTTKWKRMFEGEHYIIESCGGRHRIYCDGTLITNVMNIDINFHDQKLPTITIIAIDLPKRRKENE